MLLTLTLLAKDGHHGSMGYTIALEGPLLVTRIHDAMTDAEQAEYFARIEQEIFERGVRHGSLVVAPHGTVWTTDQRKHHRAFDKRNQTAIRALCVATAVVMPEVSTVVRFALSAAMMLAPGSPARAFHDEPIARRWLRGYTHQVPLQKSATPTR